MDDMADYDYILLYSFTHSPLDDLCKYVHIHYTIKLLLSPFEAQRYLLHGTRHGLLRMGMMGILHRVVYAYIY